MRRWAVIAQTSPCANKLISCYLVHGPAAAHQNIRFRTGTLRYTYLDFKIPMRMKRYLDFNRFASSFAKWYPLECSVISIGVLPFREWYPLKFHIISNDFPICCLCADKLISWRADSQCPLIRLLLLQGMCWQAYKLIIIVCNDLSLEGCKYHCFHCDLSLEECKHCCFYNDLRFEGCSCMRW